MQSLPSSSGEDYAQSFTCSGYQTDSKDWFDIFKTWDLVGCEKKGNDENTSDKKYFGVDCSTIVKNITGLVGGTGWWIGQTQPYLASLPTNLTLMTGHTARLTCRVHSLGKKQVTWMRMRDLHILTVGRLTYTADDRFKVRYSHTQISTHTFLPS
ncbi:hypothetical protein Pcinc_042478 [Petrolisthes cinctipes]|uniref:Ig-like domain-containing protein n=1 Tax=Petrolisthes cinctipes TaxID=88211 RepID=A0AAE1EFZ3_PETCI|nr:hypothetical protein Pcinc_042478 [Petrolisthes cinctipes]